MINPNNPRDLGQLSRAIEWSRYRLEPFRANRLHALKEFVGAHYSWSGAPQKVPLNLLQLAMNIYLRQLVARAPRAMCSSEDPALVPVAADMQAWMDKATVGMRLGESLRTFVMNALFSIGIMKVGEEYKGSISVLGTTQHYGQPFAEPVDLDDWVHDIRAKRYDQVSFAGNRYSVSYNEARANPFFDVQARNSLTSQTRYAYNERGDLRTTTLSQSTQHSEDSEVEPQCELWDIWLPREKLILVMPYQEAVLGGFGNVRPLQVIPWQGPEQGPYVLLSYCDVPDNIMPAAPVQALRDLHELVNILWRKLTRQAIRQKTVLGVMGTASDDAERLNRSNDGDAVRIDFPDRVAELSTGGVKNENIAIALQAKQLYDEMAGGLSLLGGISPQSPTLGQDQLLHQQSSTQISEMQDRTINATQEVYGCLGQWWWTNPVLTYSAQRQVAGVDILVSITPQMRQIPWEKLSLEIDPYSMQHDTPQARLALMKDLLMTVVMPAMPMIAQQGGKLDWQEIMGIFARYGNYPELGRILKFGPPPEQQGPLQQSQQAEMPMPAQTTRHTVRTSRPAMTNKGQSQVLSQLLLGGGNGQQKAMMGRPNG